VLSGFLITGILLNARDAARRAGQPETSVLRVFYARRILRIVPIYYLAILIGWWVSYRPITDHIWWLLTYTSNVSWAFFGGAYASANHLWSLCVEEQFYLFWPLLVLFVPPRRIRGVAVGLITASIAYKTIGGFAGLSWEATNFVLIGCLDSLGMGALLAILWHELGPAAAAVRRFVRCCLVVGTPLLIALQAFKFSVGLVASKRTPAYALLIDFASSLCFVPLIDLAARNTRTLLGSLLSLNPVRFIGKISYGVYLYHFFLVALMPSLLRAAGLTPLMPGVAMFTLYTLITVGVATLSFYAIERPINAWKRYFPYHPR
jgi:peptidoglycan/LPS O-acetylase OafA/YrhL